MNKHGIILVLALVLAVSVCACFVVVYATPLKVARADHGIPLDVAVYYTNYSSHTVYTATENTLVAAGTTPSYNLYSAPCVCTYDDSVYQSCDFDGVTGSTVNNFRAWKSSRNTPQNFAYCFYFVKSSGSGTTYIELQYRNNFDADGNTSDYGWYVREYPGVPSAGNATLSILADDSFTIVFSDIPMEMSVNVVLQDNLIETDMSLQYDTYYYTHFGSYNWSLLMFTHADDYHVSSYVLQNVPANIYSCTLTYHGVSPVDHTTPLDLVSSLAFDENNTIILSAPPYVNSITISYPGSQTTYTLTDDPDDSEDWIDIAHENFTYLAYEEPYGIAYYNGYNEGIRMAHENNLVNMTFAALQLPFKLLFGTWDSTENTYIDGLFTITILGVDLRAFVLGILSAVIIVRLLRLIIGVAGSTGGGA